MSSISKLKYENTLNKPPRMTYVLGSRCVDGVVIISDTKFTIDSGFDIGYIYDTDKITGEFTGYITAFAGKRHKFERFRSEIREFRSTQPCQISVDRLLIGMSDIMAKINRTTSDDNFELLVGISGVYFPDRRSVLRHFSISGGYVPINSFKAIGSEPFGKVYLRYWRLGMTMNEVAELGYFIIKYIQEMQLDNGVGEDSEHPIQIRFIPDNPTKDKIDFGLDEQTRKNFQERTKTRLDRIRNESFML